MTHSIPPSPSSEPEKSSARGASSAKLRYETTTLPSPELDAYPIAVDSIPSKVLREGRYEVRFARTPEELDQILRLRFEVFNLELGEGLEASFETHRDLDEFDPVCHHLMVVEEATQEVVGTYRMQTSAMARAHHGFYAAAEFDLSQWPQAVIDDSVELGRACVAAEHRNTQVLFLLWKGLALYVATNHSRWLFGCCSLTSQDPAEGKAVMELLEKRGQVHPELRVVPQPGYECYHTDPGSNSESAPAEPRPDAPRAKLPKLFRIYLRHGALACGPPAIDRQFKTIDYLVMFDVAAMDKRRIRTFFG